MNLAARAQAIIDDRLMQAYWASVEHLGTTDLVMCLDTALEVDPVRPIVREEFLAEPAVPSAIKEKVSKPAKDAARILKGGSTAFWLVASFPDGETITTAVIAQRLGQGGAA